MQNLYPSFLQMVLCLDKGHLFVSLLERSLGEVGADVIALRLCPKDSRILCLGFMFKSTTSSK